MPDILVRNLEPDLAKGIKELARRRGRSLQAELHELIAEAVRRDRAREAAVRDLTTMRARLKRTGRSFSDSTELIREDRDR